MIYNTILSLSENISRLNSGIYKPFNWQVGFQTPASPVMEGIINFHHDLFFFLTAILFFVMYILVRCLVLFEKSVNPQPLIVVHNSTIEIIWTIIPALILILIAVPSFSLLYSMDEIIDPLFTLKVIGHQWYWSYEIFNPNILLKIHNILYYHPKFNPNEVSEVAGTYLFDSYMLATEDLRIAGTRLLDVDNRVYLPIETNIRILVTAADVIHSWAIPSLGLKIDALPGRLNQTTVYIKRPGIFFGQCSEICGINHGFMPIAVAGIDILGDGYKLDVSSAEAIIPLYSSLLGKLY